MTPEAANTLVTSPTINGKDMPAWLGGDLSARLAMDLAMRLHPTEDILKRYGIDAPHLAKMLNTSAFQAMLREAKLTWDNELNSADRIRIKSSVALEDSIETVYHMVHDDKLPSAARLDAIKTLAKLAKADVAGDGGGVVPFSVTINLGEKESIAFTTEAPPKVIDN